MKPDVTDALHGQRLDAIEKTLDEFRTEFRESLKPLAEDVRANTGWRERMSGALKLALIIVGVFGTGALGWATYLTVTTIRTEQAVNQLGHELRHPGKAPARDD